MTVFIEMLKPSGLYAKGEVIKLYDITKIFESNGEMIYSRINDWQTSEPKDTHRILGIKF